MTDYTKTWYRYRQFPIDKNLSELNVFLNTQRVVHRFTEEGSSVTLWLIKEQQIDGLNQFIDRYLEGDIDLSVSKDQKGASALRSMGDVRMYFLRAPLTFLMIALGAVGYFIASVLPPNDVYFLFSSVPRSGLFTPQDIWRLITPVFIHYGPMHILMNALWMAILGMQIEPRLGRRHYIILFFTTALGGNVLQVFSQPNSFFGGLSGVVYGYTGVMIWMNYIAKDPHVKSMPGLLFFIIISLFLGFSGSLDAVLDTRIANWAHLGGLLSGFLFAAMYYLKGASNN